jgi:hypothetical protein
MSHRKDLLLSYDLDRVILMENTYTPVEIKWNTELITLVWAYGGEHTMSPTALLNMLIENHQFGNYESNTTIIEAIIRGQEK